MPLSYRLDDAYKSIDDILILITFSGRNSYIKYFILSCRTKDMNIAITCKNKKKTEKKEGFVPRVWIELGSASVWETAAQPLRYGSSGVIVTIETYKKWSRDVNWTLEQKGSDFTNGAAMATILQHRCWFPFASRRPRLQVSCAGVRWVCGLGAEEWCLRDRGGPSSGAGARFHDDHGGSVRGRGGCRRPAPETEGREVKSDGELTGSLLAESIKVGDD